MSPTLGAPWLAPLAPTLTLLGPLAMAGHWSVCLDRLNQMAHERGIVNARGHPLRFIDASLARPIPYESHVWLHGEVPTRTGEGAWHDFFNALMWITLPQTKAQLNALQAAAIEREVVLDSVTNRIETAVERAEALALEHGVSLVEAATELAIRRVYDAMRVRRFI